MNGNSTTITDPENNEPRSFTFDYSYWSFDGGKEQSDGYVAPDKSHKNGSKFSDQVHSISSYKKLTFNSSLFLFDFFLSAETSI